MLSFFNLCNFLFCKGKYWFYNVYECIFLRGFKIGNFNFYIVGGVENGEFICIGDVK